MQTPTVKQFHGHIGPANLLGLVRNTAPFLFTAAEPPAADARLVELAAAPLGWQAIIRGAERLPAVDVPTAAQREDYFALCLAAHMGTAGTFIPTDVDAKIRGVLWSPKENPAVLRRMADTVLAARAWDIAPVSARIVDVPGSGRISGHDGELLGVMSGALGCFLANGDSEYAQRLAAAVEGELERESAGFLCLLRRPGAELDVLRLATVLTHNAGDVDQGLSFWREEFAGHPLYERFGRLAHENAKAFGGAFQVAAHLYRTVMSAEGHRNYPLRTVKNLRTTNALLLPIGPFLDEWGAAVATHRALTTDDRADIMTALLQGCRKIPGQQGYYRALAGMAEALGGSLDQVAKRLPAAQRQVLKDAETRRLMAVRQGSFESSLRKRTAAELVAARR